MIIHVFLLSILFSNSISVNFLKKYHKNDSMISITTSLMQSLEIRHGIVVEEDKNNRSTFQKLKSFAFNFIPITYNIIEELFEYIKIGSFPYEKTILIFKEKHFFDIVKMLELLKNISYRISQFTWLIFLEKSYSKEFYERLLIPYNCEFFSVHPVNVTNYVLTEIYKLKNITKIFEFGTYDYNQGLKITNISTVVRRLDFNKTELIVGSLGTREEVSFRILLKIMFRIYIYNCAFLEL